MIRGYWILRFWETSICWDTMLEFFHHMTSAGIWAWIPWLWRRDTPTATILAFLLNPLQSVWTWIRWMAMILGFAYLIQTTKIYLRMQAQTVQCVIKTETKISCIITHNLVTFSCVSYLHMFEFWVYQIGPFHRNLPSLTSQNRPGRSSMAEVIADGSSNT